MNNDFRDYSNYLMHYGVKGMKWKDHVYAMQDKWEQTIGAGNRRYQGSARYLDDSGTRPTLAGVQRYELKSDGSFNKSRLVHDLAVRKAAEILMKIDDEIKKTTDLLFYHRERIGVDGRADSIKNLERRKRRDNYESKILEGEKKVKSIFGKWGINLNLSL